MDPAVRTRPDPPQPEGGPTVSASLYLVAMIAVPAVGAAVTAALPRGREELARQSALGVSLVVLVLAVLATIAFDADGERFQLTSSVEWIPDFGVSFALGVDGIALVMLLLIGVLVPVVVGASWNDEATDRRSMKAFFAWLLLLEAMMVGVFAATDIFLFYVFFEAMLVPMYFIIGSFGGPRRQYAAVKFFLYSLVGGMVKVGTFGFLRYCLPLFPDASRYFAPFVLVLSVAGILYAALLAMGQSDMKRLVSYTSISHFGFIGLGIFAFTTEAATGAVLYMVNHGIATGLLFLVVGMVIARGGSRQIGDYGGIAAKAPVLAGSFLVAGLASLAMPGTNSFVSEFLVLIGSFPTEPIFTVIATVGIILAALYILLMYQRTMHGPARGVLLQEDPAEPVADTGGATATLPAPTRTLRV